MRSRGVRGIGWLSVLCAPMSMAMAAAFCTGLALLHEVARVLRAAEVVRRQVAAAAEDLIAETALADHFEGKAVVDTHLGGQATTSVERLDRGLLVQVRTADRERWYASRELAGAAPRLLGQARSIGVLDAEPVRGAMPALDPEQLAAAQRAERSAVFVRDSGIALLHLAVGTDREDFRLGSGSPHVSFAGIGELVVVPGHLWIDPAPMPLLLELERDTVVVVQGNLYVGRSVRVHGPGRLLLVTTVVDGACAFADRDGDGRWSAGERVCGAEAFAGPVEGSGGAWFAAAGSNQPFEVGFGLVVAGQLMLDRPVAIGGPLVVARGVTATRPEGALQATVPWTFRTDRELAPGFLVCGGRRPGRLVPVGLRRPDDPFRDDGKQTLYLAAPSR